VFISDISVTGHIGDNSDPLMLGGSGMVAHTILS
jgi:hypothetical protein